MIFDRFRPAAAPSLPERTRRRVALYLIPYLFFLYVLAYLDRINVSVAALQLEEPLSEGGMGFDRAIIGFGAGIFFWGYWILEIPSTISVLKWGARWVFVRILVLWGLACVLVGLIDTPFANSLFAWLPTIPEDAGMLIGLDWFTNALFGWIGALLGYSSNLNLFSGLAHFANELPHNAVNQFYFFRFMLGFFEGGFFPSVIVYLSLWFRPEDRAKAIASFMAAIPLSSLVGAPLSGLLLDINWLGLPGWRWIFILQGVAPILAGIATLFMLPDRPEKAKWLPADERDWLLGELHKEHHGKETHGHLLWLKHAGLVLLLTAAYFCLNVTSYGLSMFMPAILKSQSSSWMEDPSSGWSIVWRHLDNWAANLGIHLELSQDFQVSVLTALPYLMALIAMLVNGWHSDRSRERIGHVAVPLCCLSVGITLAALCDGYGIWPVLIMIFLVGTFLYAHLPAYWPIPSMFLGSLVAASAIGFINMTGNLGGFVGPLVVGTSAAGQDSFAPALYRLAPLPAMAALFILFVGFLRRKQLAAARAGTVPANDQAAQANGSEVAVGPVTGIQAEK